MLYLSIPANGEVNIKTTFLEGSISSASAGLFVLFFGFLTSLLAVFLKDGPAEINTKSAQTDVNLVVSIILICALFIFEFMHAIGLTTSGSAKGTFLILSVMALSHWMYKS